MGGEMAHTLSIAEMPSHNHNERKGSDSYSNLVLQASPWNKWGDSQGKGSSSGWYWGEGVASQGGGGAHNNLPPYLVVYIWKRTA